MIEAKFDPKDFTEPFDLKRWESGEVARRRDSDLFASFISQQDGAYKVEFEGKGNYRNTALWSLAGMQTEFFMRPAPKVDDGWIPHTGSTNPIPWAKGTEAKVRLRRGEILDIRYVTRWHNAASNDECNTGDIIAYRLTDGWIPVLEGKPPFGALANEWEYKTITNDGIQRIATGSTEDYIREGMFITNGYKHIVAVRRIPTAHADPVNTSPECVEEVEKSGHVPLPINEEADPYKLTQKQKERFDELTKPRLYRPLSQNEVMRIAGDAINGTRKGEVVSVERDVFVALMRDVS